MDERREQAGKRAQEPELASAVSALCGSPGTSAFHGSCGATIFDHAIRGAGTNYFQSNSSASASLRRSICSIAFRTGGLT